MARRGERDEGDRHQHSDLEQHITTARSRGEHCGRQAREKRDREKNAGQRRDIRRPFLLHEARWREEVSTGRRPRRQPRWGHERREHGPDRDGGVPAAARRIHQGALERDDDHESQPERVRAVKIRPQQNERDAERERGERAATHRAKEGDQNGEANEAEELGTIRPREARDADRRKRHEYGDERSARSLGERGPRDDADEHADREGAQRDRATPRPDRVGRVEQELAEPLIGKDRFSCDRPRIDVDARHAVSRDVTTDREVPKEVTVGDRRARGRERREAGEEQRNDEERSHRKGRCSRSAVASSDTTVHPRSRSAATSGRSGRRSTCAMAWRSSSSCHRGRKKTISS